MNIKKKIIKSKIVSLLYGARFYLNLGVAQVAWFSNKSVDLMAFLFIADRFGLILSDKQIIILCFVFTVCLLGVGYFLKKSGLYDVELYTNASRNPVESEILEAARIIKKGDKNNNE